MLLDDPATDGQAQPGAAFLVRVAVADLHEAIEDRFEFVRANAAALIPNTEHQFAVGLGRVDPDGPAARRRELDGIRQQIGHHLQQPVWIDPQARVVGHDFEGDARLFGHCLDAIGRLSHQVANVAPDPGHRQPRQGHWLVRQRVGLFEPDR